MNHDIFISYSSKQKSIADGVCHYLEENGFKCWMAPRDIPGGRKYGDCIYDAIIECKVFVLVFSEAASLSPWVNGEIHRAFSNNIPILPFRVDETQVKGDLDLMLNQFHWIDAFPQYADRLPDLINSISGLLGKPAKNVNFQGDSPIRDETTGWKPNRSEKPTNSFNGHEYVDLGLPSGTLWATCNVGAKNPEEYGDYFAWGETQPKTEYNWSTYKYCYDGVALKLTKYCNKRKFGNNRFIDRQTELQESDDAAAVNFGEGWTMPSEEQWVELHDNCNSVWTTQNGIKGKQFVGCNGSSLFLPAAGSCFGGGLDNVGVHGDYWCNSLYIDDPCYALFFSFGSGPHDNDNVFYGGFGRSVGKTVRPVRSKKYLC